MGLCLLDHPTQGLGVDGEAQEILAPPRRATRSGARRRRHFLVALPVLAARWQSILARRLPELSPF